MTDQRVGRALSKRDVAVLEFAERRAAARPLSVSPRPERSPMARDAVLAEIDRIRAMTPPGPQDDSVGILRAIRDD